MLNFHVRHGKKLSKFQKITARVPQGGDLGPIFYLQFTRDIPQDNNTTMATFADDTSILAVGKDADVATDKLQRAV